jgi:hypothetical protein
MIDHDLSIHFVRYGLFVACMFAMCAGVLVVRWTPDRTVMRKRLQFSVAILCAILVVVGGCALAFFSVEAASWALLLYASYCAGALIEICESDPVRAKAAIKAFLAECGRQWGKVPTSH